MSDTVDLEIIEEEKPPLEVVVDEAVAAPEPVVTGEDGVAQLKANLDAAEQARQSALAEAQAARQEAAAAHQEVHGTNKALIDNAIATVKQNGEMLKNQYRDAMAAGDWDLAAQSQHDMSMNSSRLVALEQGKETLDRVPVQKVEHVDPVEQMASRLDGPAASWLRSHPEYARDARLNQRLIGAHNLAMADGHAPSSPAYFEAVETTLKIRQPEAAAPARSSAPAAAPVTKTGTVNGRRPGQVTLSRDELEAASDMGMSPEEYGRNKLALIKEGKMH